MVDKPRERGPACRVAQALPPVRDGKRRHSPGRLTPHPQQGVPPPPSRCALRCRRRCGRSTPYVKTVTGTRTPRGEPHRARLQRRPTGCSPSLCWQTKSKKPGKNPAHAPLRLHRPLDMFRRCFRGLGGFRRSIWSRRKQGYLGFNPLSGIRWFQTQKPPPPGRGSGHQFQSPFGD